MTNIEHLIAWIESSRPHYDRLCELERERKTRESAGTLKIANATLALRAFNIASDAYREATTGCDMYAEQWDARSLLDAAGALLEWELEQ